MAIGVIGGMVALGLTAMLLRDRIPHAAYRGGVILYVLIPFAALAYAIWSGWGEWIGNTEFVLFVTFAILTGFGTTVGYHRLLTHRSFQTRPAIRAVLMILGAMSLPTRPIDWAANHLKHHAFSDRDGDPHSPLDGFFHAHIGWVLASPPAERERYCQKLLADPLVMFFDRTVTLWFTLGLIIPFLIAGWPGLLWGGLIRVGFHNHLIFSINSVCHTFGDRPFATRDESRNNWVMSLLGFGEGWHNNHHAFPAMAYHGMNWRQPDLSGLLIRALVKLGLAWDVKQPTPDLIARRRQRPQLDMTPDDAPEGLVHR